MKEKTFNYTNKTEKEIIEYLFSKTKNPNLIKRNDKKYIVLKRDDVGIEGSIEFAFDEKGKLIYID